MVFSSFSFLVAFLPLVIVGYYIIPKKYTKVKNIILLIASLIFYSFGEPKYTILMVVSILVNYILTLLMSKKNNNKVIFVFTIIIDIGILVFFKYSNFIINNINNVFNTNINNLNIDLPLGISFYTFQIMSYVIDVYKKKIKPQKSLINIATYITLFPQLVAGPIVNYKTIENELEKRDETFDKFASGFRRFIVGLAKKVIIANNAAILADSIFNSDIQNLGTSIIWIGALAYSIQIYFDFSGYSDMAIGLGRIFGFNFLENFNYPYISKSITDFWRRWHISLSSWFKEYVYIPPRGNRCKKIKWFRNIFIVWMLTGLWHGASWNYVLWGIYFAVILIIEKVFLLKILEKVPNFFKHIYSIILILIGWVIFRVEDIHNLLYCLKHLVIYKPTDFSVFIGNNGDVLSVIPFIFIGILFSTPIIKKVHEKICNTGNELLFYAEDIIIIALFIISMAFIVSLSYNPFIYFKF